MHPAKEDMPTPLSTLNTLFDGGDSSERPYKVFIGHNLGNRTFLAHVPMHEFFRISEVANDPVRDGDSVAQRKLDPTHAHKLALFLLKGLISAAISYRQIQGKPPLAALEAVLDAMGPQPYMSMQPIVVNIRNCDPAGANIRGMRLLTKEDETACFKAFLSQRHVFWVVDGQHRRRGMQIVFDFLEVVLRQQAYPKKGSLYQSQGDQVTADELQVWQECYEVARSFCNVAVEVHLGLNPEQERQLFHDLNKLGKKIDSSLALVFDSANPVNLYIKDRLIDGLGLKVAEKDSRDWQDDAGNLTWKDVVAVNSVLILNKTNIGGATPADVNPRVDTAVRFWEAVKAIPGFGEDRAKERTVAAQPVMLKALAKLTYDFAFNARRNDDASVHLELLLSSISDFDFSHSNPMWRYYEMTDAERKSNGLEDLTAYLPASDGANRDIGSHQGGFMRFGAKHNDIFPVLGDMIRWKLKLPNRWSHAMTVDELGL